MFVSFLWPGQADTGGVGDLGSAAAEKPVA